jgi:capsular polysaccharide export protein
MTDRFADLPDTLYVHNVAWIKWPLLLQCFGRRRLLPLPAAERVPADACVVSWGAQPLPAGVTPRWHLRLEDGFLRSVGLGVDLVRPVSWVVDRSGLHFDPTAPSDLETLLRTRAFTAEDLDRAQQLRERVVAAGLTKYNTAGATWQRPPGDRPVVLVVGQVPTDAALRTGGGGITNAALIERTRALRPDAYLVYKVHPDLLAGLRADAHPVGDRAHYCDAVIGAVDLDSLLRGVDEVHVAASLTGFEALLRGVPVVCHGRPFYSGWGLTQDRVAPSERRGIPLTLDELVAGALLHYPVYLSREFKGRISAETAVDQLLRWRERGDPEQDWWRPLYRRVLRRVVGVK